MLDPAAKQPESLRLRWSRLHPELKYLRIKAGLTRQIPGLVLENFAIVQLQIMFSIRSASANCFQRCSSVPV